MNLRMSLFWLLFLFPCICLSETPERIKEFIQVNEKVEHFGPQRDICRDQVVNNPSTYGKTIGTETLKAPMKGISKKRPFKISVVSEEYAQQLFDYMEDSSHIPFGFPEEGCYARAHEMSRMLENLDVKTGKVFQKGILRVKTDKSPRPYVEWWWHVAPVLFVEKEFKAI